MRPTTSKAMSVANNPWFMVLGGAASIIGFIAYLYEKVDPQFGNLGKVALLLGLLLLFLGYFYSIKVRAENIALREMSRLFYEINEIYKKQLRDSFFGPNPVASAKDRLTIEHATLKSVCERIENIFQFAISRPCMVTIKLITVENHSASARTYVRSQDMCVRDDAPRVDFSVGNGQNTAFDTALVTRADGRPSHFFSPDLEKDEKEGRYSNERLHYKQFYNSAIVVPIRGIRPAASGTIGGTPGSPDLLGFLCVDTRSANRLNDKYHLYMLAALGHQMYNFMSLMRGHYHVQPPVHT